MQLFYIRLLIFTSAKSTMNARECRFGCLDCNFYLMFSSQMKYLFWHIFHQCEPIQQSFYHLSKTIIIYKRNYNLFCLVLENAL